MIPNGIDVEAVRAAAKPRAHVESGVVHVAWVGRIVAVKRLDVFLRAAAEIVRDPNVRYCFHVIGDGPLRAESQQLASRLGINRDCIFHGFQREATRWLAAMHCLVLTSDHEGLPMTALEARALSVPVVAHAVGGLVPLLKEESDCKLVTTQEPSAIAEAIRSATATRAKSRPVPIASQILDRRHFRRVHDDLPVPRPASSPLTAARES